MEEKYTYVLEKTDINFPHSSNSMDFTPFSHAMGNWWGNQCISHMINYTIGYESNGKKAPILWENYEYQFPRFSAYGGFSRIFPGTILPGFSHLMDFPAFSHAMRNWWENPCISNMMKYTTGWESNGKKIHFMEKVWEPISQAFPIRWILLTFLMLWEIWWENPCIFYALKYTIR